MNFDLSDDQRLLKDSIDRLITDQYQLDQRAQWMAQPQGWSPEVWSEFVEMGLTMLPFPESLGGLGLGSVELMIVGEAFGRGIVVEPYLSSIVLAGAAIQYGAGDQTEALLATLMSGETTAGFADRADVQIDNDCLSGKAPMVLGGNSADVLVIPYGDGAFCVPAMSNGITRRAYRLHGGGGAAEVTFDRVPLDTAIRLDDGCMVRAREAGIAFLAAEAAGAMQAALDASVDYLKTRVQFGKPIGTNQVLQHMAADMLVEVEQARSAAIYAAILANETDADERARGMAAVKAVIGRAAKFVAQTAVQLHGGMGVSEEHVVSHWFRRLTAIDMILGSADHHVKHLAALGGFTSARPHLA